MGHSVWKMSQTSHGVKACGFLYCPQLSHVCILNPLKYWSCHQIHNSPASFWFERCRKQNKCKFCPGARILILFRWSVVWFNNTTWVGRKAIQRKLLFAISIPKTAFQVQSTGVLYCERLEASDSHSFPSPPCCHGDIFSLSYYILHFSKNFIASGPSSLGWDIFHWSWCNTQR